MQPQAGLGAARVALPPTVRLDGVYLAQVLTVLPALHAVSVLLPALAWLGSAPTGVQPDGTATPAGLRAKVLEHRAGPYHGELDLPREGDWGLVVFPQGSDQLAVWLGSLYQDLASLATPNRREKIGHHDSGVWWRMADDGTTEFSHPSGIYVRIGAGSALSVRTRQEPQGAVSRTVSPYTPPALPAATLHLQHSSGAVVDIDPIGNMTVTSPVKLVIQADDVTIESTDASPGLHLHLGGAAGEDFIAKRGALANVAAVFNAHVHTGGGAGDTGVPTTPVSFSQGGDYSTNAKVS